MAIQTPMIRSNKVKHVDPLPGKGKTEGRMPRGRAVPVFFLFTFLFFFNLPGVLAQQMKQPVYPVVQEGEWQVKVLHPDGYILDVRAFDRMGNFYEIKAVKDSCQSYIMDIGAYLDDKILPVKVLLGAEEQKRVSAIDDQGQTYLLRAITPEGRLLPIIGISSSVYTIDVKAVTPEGRLLNLRAVSPEGKLREVKGIKMYEKSLETTLHGVEVQAHMVVLPQLQ